MPPHTEINPHLGLGVPEREWKRAHKQPSLIGPCSAAWRIWLGLQLSYGTPGTTQWVAAWKQGTPNPGSFATRLHRGVNKPILRKGEKPREQFSPLRVEEPSSTNSEKEIKAASLSPFRHPARARQAAALTITAEKYMLVTPYMMMKMRASERLLKQ